MSHHEIPLYLPDYRDQEKPISYSSTMVYTVLNVDASNNHLDPLINSLRIVGDIILSISSLVDTLSLEAFLEKYPLQNYWVSSKISNNESLEIQAVVKLLDSGAAKIVLPASTLLKEKQLFSEISSERLAASISVSSVSEQSISDLSGLVSSFVINIEEENIALENVIKNLENFIKLAASHQNINDGKVPAKFAIILPQNFKYSFDAIRQISSIGADLIIPFENLSLDSSDSTTINIADVLSCQLTSDRSDGLFTTIVVDERNTALGVVYSSAESLREAVKSGKGVYQSRKRGLWYKGATSGATQDLKKIEIDCDGDALKFIVTQHGSGFCHLNTRSCFGTDVGLTALEKTLQSRKIAAPVGSYSHRLFQNPDLLRSKIMEEADELCAATSKEDIAWEAADLIYFILVKCIGNGVSLADIEAQLDKRAKKVSRRPGNAKPQWQQASADGNDESKVGSLNGDDNASLSKPISKSETIKMQHYRASEISMEKRSSLLLRPIIRSDDIMSRVRPIIEDVRKRGDAALIEFTAKFDGVQLETPVISAPFPAEAMALDDITRAAIDKAYDNIFKFHEAQYDRATLVVETMPGVTCSRYSRPIEKVGLYVPGGTAILPSTALMLGIPAKVAGCKEIVFASPPRKDGTVIPEVLYVAHKVGASKVVLAGGAQAVAALAYGTESVPKVDKICGPGNQYVTAAKMFAQNDSSAMVSIDMPAGPSELLVIADNSSNPEYVASDLLSQAEHGTDSQVVLIAVSLTQAHLQAIENEIHEQASRLPRVNIVKESIGKSFILEVDNIEAAMRFSNDYAPEHLILHLENAEQWVEKVDNAGSVFVGSYSPESCGDYASGTNHTLPTYGYARMYSGVNTLTFLKHITAQKLTKDGLNLLGDTVMRLAEVEGLEAHRNAVAVRIKDIR
ncbi:5072_t:CDS:2 [Ambispora leptoticha]|uniref:Histidine biosynthesis trifunctional protein n=1 Tax=Ambispora leptoticha TaxID=144679 RepID=A0A9N8V222_9GLOM|nr:5072_t:CDS:2 [Ambispora leptoticha]